VDLSVGTPVDSTPLDVQSALRDCANAPGYPTTWGTPALRGAISDWLRRTLTADVDPAAILPVIGTKEFVAWLPTLLGLTAEDTVVIPEVAYPTYDVGARIAGAKVVRSDDPQAVHGAAMVWLNTPSNPTGRVLSAVHLREVVRRARDTGAIVVSDECYITLAWEAEPISLLAHQVCAGDTTGLLMVHSLSKRSSMAGYRFGFVAGDPRLVARLLEVRKHAGMIVPMPVQAAATVAYADDIHAQQQRDRYAARRAALRPALEAQGFRIDHSEAGLYLWATRSEPCWQTVAWLAERGILVAPGDFYGPDGAQHVRIALTATDERIAAGVARLGM
jgi:succinyldiaminopimelate transaminase